MSDRKLRLQVRNADLLVVAPLDLYSEAEFVLKWNPISLETCSTFMVSLPMRRRDAFGRLRWNPAAVALLEDGAGITSSLDGQRLLTGSVEEPERTRSGSGPERLDVFGYSDDQWIAVRNAWPAPYSNSLETQDAAAYDVRNGPCETVVKGYVDANAGPSSPAERRVGKLVVPPSTGLGSVIPGRARFYNLAETITDLCSEGGGLGWRVVQVGLELRFEVFQPRDRTKHARFSPELRNLTSYKLMTPKAKVTRAIAAGGGQGVNRLFQEAKVAVPWWKYREAYIDRRDAGGGTEQVMTGDERLAAQAELVKAATDAVASGQLAASFAAPIQDTPAVGFMRQYGALDKVTVSVGGASLQDVVRQVSVKGNEAGVDIVPTVGVASQAPDADLIRRLQDLERRQTRIERGL